MPLAHAQELLYQIPLFRELSDQDLNRLSLAIRRLSLKKGAVLFRKGDEGTSLYIVKRGKIKIVLPSRLGDEVIVTIFAEGDFFGELSLFDGQPRSADALSIEPSEIYILNRSDFLAFLQSDITAMKSILSQLAKRLRDTDDFLEDTCFLSVSARLAKKLVSLTTAYGRSVDDQIHIDLTLTQKELGDMVGSTRESINKALKTLREQGLITTKENKIIVTDLSGLKKKAR